MKLRFLFILPGVVVCRLALRNTSLIQVLLSIDTRIRPLVFSVRQWARVRGVAGQLSAGSKLTNYALTMIVFFYLQTRSPPILPSVDQLSHLAGELTNITLCCPISPIFLNLSQSLL